MRTIERANQLKRDYKRETKGQHRATLEQDFTRVVKLLVSDLPLPERYRDHALTGDWKNFRDCHIKPDLVQQDGLHPRAAGQPIMLENVWRVLQPMLR